MRAMANEPSPLILPADRHLQVSVGVMEPLGVRPIFSLTWNTRNGGGSLVAAGPSIPYATIESALAQLEEIVKEARQKLAAAQLQAPPASPPR